MTAYAAVTNTLIGMRSAMFVLAIMVVLAWARTPAPKAIIDRYRNHAWVTLGSSVLLFAPQHMGWLVGHPLPRITGRTLDLGGAALICATLVLMLAIRALKNGVSLERVHRGMAVCVALIVSLVAVTWIVR